jgi:RNA polymerase sigma-70 factor (ECF subfamily)
VPPPIEVPSPEADELVAAAIKGDTGAFASLFTITFPSVYRYLYGRCGDVSLAEDLTQDTFLRALRAVKTSFKGKSGEFLAWIIRIARNRFLDHVKSGRVRWEIVVEETPIVFDPSNPESEALALVEGADLKKALSRLTGDQQEILYLRFFQGLQIAEVAAATSRTEGAVKAMQFRALRALARVLGTEGFFDMGAEA